MKQNKLLELIKNSLIVDEERFNNPKFIETNSSLILFIKNEVFKIIKEEKGPEYSNLKSRYDWLCEEIRINAEITDNLYLDVKALLMEQGQIKVGKENASRNTTVEYALCMKRLNQKSLVRNMLISDSYSNKHSIVIAKKIADFHLAKLSGCLTLDDQDLIKKFSSFEALKKTIKSDFRKFESNEKIFIPETITKQRYQEIKKSILSFLATNKNLLKNRSDKRYVVPIHGDFHSLNIFVERGVVYAVDRALRRHLRVSDVIKDPAYFSVDLEIFGFNREKEYFLSTYRKKVHDPDFETLFPFYLCRFGFVGGMANYYQGGKRLSKPYFDLAYKYK